MKYKTPMKYKKEFTRVRTPGVKLTCSGCSKKIGDDQKRTQVNHTIRHRNGKCDQLRAVPAWVKDCGI